MVTVLGVEAAARRRAACFPAPHCVHCVLCILDAIMMQTAVVSAVVTQARHDQAEALHTLEVQEAAAAKDEAAKAAALPPERKKKLSIKAVSNRIMKVNSISSFVDTPTFPQSVVPASIMCGLTRFR